MYLYMKHLCLHVEKYSLFAFFFLFFFLPLFWGDFVGGSSGKNPETKHEEQTLVCCCGNPVTLGIKCFCFLEESLTRPVLKAQTSK